MKGRAITAIAAACALLALAGCKKEELSSAKVETRDVVGYELLEGAIVTPPSARADVISPFRAPVDEVRKSIGDPVNRGEVLVQLSIPNVDASLEQATMYQREAQTAYSGAKRSLAMPLRQAEENLRVAREAEKAARANMDPEIQRYTDARVAAELVVAQAKVELDNNLQTYKYQVEDASQYMKDARDSAKQGQVRAPITGTVIAINAKPGTEVGVDAREPVATIVNLGRLQIHAPMSAEAAGRYKAPVPVVLMFSEIPDKQYTGNISRIVTAPSEDDPKVITYTAIIEFANTDAQVMPNMKVRMVGIKTGEKKDVIAVPNGAIQKDKTGKPVVMVLEGSEWKPRVVELGLTGIDYTEIKSGLKADETVQVRVAK